MEAPFVELRPPSGDDPLSIAIIHFRNGFVAPIVVHPTTAKKEPPYPVWRYEMREGRIWLYGVGSDSVKILSADRHKELAHETIAGWLVIVDSNP